MTGDALPDEERHYHNAVAVLDRMAGRPATIRTFDLGADKLARFLQEAALDEANPALGLRSIRLCLADLGRDLFRAQLRGLLRASAHGPLKIMFPMISGIAELRAAKAMLEEARVALRAAGQPFDPHVKVGIMIEMPSAALTADQLAQEADFFSIGTNDLIQYTMAVDRVNEYVSYLYEPLHPALIRLIGEVARAARTAGISVTVCGEMAGEPLMAPVLVGLGVHELSMSAVSVPEVKAVIRGMTLAGAARLVEEIRGMATAEEIRVAVGRYVADVTGPLGGVKT
jgi:phosphotransferase system enzyme I (PtsI)